MYLSHVSLKNWRNFRRVDQDLGHRGIRTLLQLGYQDQDASQTPPVRISRDQLDLFKE